MCEVPLPQSLSIEADFRAHITSEKTPKIITPFVLDHYTGLIPTRYIMATVPCHNCNGSGIHPGYSRKVCNVCEGDGTLNVTPPGPQTYIATCDSCGGDGYRDIRCDSCRGTGEDTSNCDGCHGAGRYWAPRMREYRRCYQCGGEGVLRNSEEDCSECDGEGVINVECFACRGSGEIERLRWNVRCSGDLFYGHNFQRFDRLKHYYKSWNCGARWLSSFCGVH
jgi:DnaJ-class molecular chaperone